VWESACLKELGRAVGSFLAQQALTQVAQKSIQTFLYTGEHTAACCSLHTMVTTLLSVWCFARSCCMGCYKAWTLTGNASRVLNTCVPSLPVSAHTAYFPAGLVGAPGSVVWAAVTFGWRCIPYIEPLPSKPTFLPLTRHFSPAGLVGALALPMTLSTAMRVAFGSKWLVALRRAQAAGKMLAMQLAQVGQQLPQLQHTRCGVPLTCTTFTLMHIWLAAPVLSGRVKVHLMR